MAKRPQTARKPVKKSKAAAPRRRKTAKAGANKETARLKRELAEALERQKATGEILAAISGAKFDLQAVLDTLTRSAARLCKADMATITRQRADGYFYHVTNHNFPPDWLDYTRETPLRPSRGTIVGRALMEKRAVQVPDVTVDAEYTHGFQQEKAGYRTFLGVPLLREGNPIGVFSLCRKTVAPFSKKQIELVSSFAGQAVIAIENVRLFEEVRARTDDLAESLQQQTATADVLKVISRSAFDLQPVLDTLVSSACSLCGADIGTVRYQEGSSYRLAATFGCTTEWRDHFARYSGKPDRGSVFGRTIIDGRAVHIPDVLADAEFARPEAIKLMGFRTALGVPLIREDGVFGVLNLFRFAQRAFTPKQIELVETFADQAVIAIENARLFEEVKARTDELTESLQQQTATADVLKVISRSAFDLQTVLETLVESAAQLCGADFANFWQPKGHAFYLAASFAVSGKDKEGRANKEYLGNLALTPGRGSIVGRTLEERRVVQIEDVRLDADFQLSELVAIGDYRTLLGVPVLREGVPIGIMVLVRCTVQPFTEKQIELVSTFADQAVIAIENVRLFDEVKAKTEDLRESLQQQTATADVLKVISRSAFDLRTVLDTLVQSAAQLADAANCFIFRREGNAYRLASSHGFTREYREWMEQQVIEPGRHTLVGKTALEGRTVHIPDVLTDPDYTWGESIKRGNFRTMLGIPLMREGIPIGVIAAVRPVPKPFTDKQIELVSTFADQAVIAIENVRLFDEVKARTEDLRESLEYQTAISSVLGVISRSPSDIQPVLDTIAEIAQHLCQSEQTYIQRLRDGKYHVAAAKDARPERIRFLKENPIAPGRSSMAGRVALELRPVHILDVQADKEYTLSMVGDPDYRTMLGVPLLRDGAAIGVIVLTRGVVQPFTERQIELLSTFADQALIAIENVRLFDEVRTRTEDLRESLQQQTATADVLKVISRSTFDLQTVLHTLVASAARLSEADKATITRQKGSEFYRAESYGFSDEFMDYVRSVPVTPDRGSATGRALLDGVVVHIPDVAADAEYTFSEAQRLGDYRCLLGVPMIREGIAVGVIVLTRSEPRPFTDKQIELVTTFADQAAIAIENVRLFDEVQAKTNDLSEALTYQTGSANILSVIASSPTDVEPVLQAIVASACQLCGANDAVVRLKEGDYLCPRAHCGPIPAARHNWRISRDWTAGRAVIEKKPVHVHDILSTEGDEFPETRQIALQQGHRTSLSVPMLREGESIGAIILRRIEVQPFSERQIRLLQTFADQAVIAIGNVRMFEQVQQRTSELSRSLEELRAAQDRLIQTEKLASLGQLTAGIAHEIKNPLNFINNFSALSVELIDELGDVLKPAPLDDKTREESDALAATLKSNLEKVVQHGKRADSIVRNMLLHSREGSGDRRAVDINTLVGESLNLAYHGARAEKQDFRIRLDQQYDPAAGKAEILPQEITRVLLNLISNGFYAAMKRKAEAGANNYEPELAAITRNLGDRVEIRIRDNGNGIAPEVRAKMFNPFFTTKPPGEGTGLGLSLSHDIVVKQHAGSIEVETQPGEFTEFRIVLPRTAAPG